MQLKQNDIHIWSIDCTSVSDLAAEFKLLNESEQHRANRFYFPHSKKQFVIAHSYLRKILSLYVKKQPEDIIFDATSAGKPYLPEQTEIQFNMSHSQDYAVYAIGLNQAIGVDIEQIQSDYNAKVAERYFSLEENEYLNSLKDTEKNIQFYRTWACKEALIKAMGKGIFFPLASVSVALKNGLERVNSNNQVWTIYPLTIHPQYQSALATNMPQMANISYWQFVENMPILVKG
jgi:4'-phosphopantetheinyl transferase